MRRCGVLLALNFLNSSLVAQTSLRFANIPWGATAAEVRAKLATAKFTVDSVDSDGDIDFHGKINHHEVYGFVFLANGHAVKVYMTVAQPGTTPRSARELYTEINESMETKYGPPTIDADEVDYPYTKGEPDADQAIGAGLAHISRVWIVTTPDGEEGIVTSILKNMNVSVAYESAAWPTEVQRRRARTPF
jgi:hypothetical protein